MNFFRSFILSLLTHGLLACGVGIYLSWNSGDEKSISLDQTSVELSFAETEDNQAPVTPTLPSAVAPDIPHPPLDDTPPKAEKITETPKNDDIKIKELHPDVPPPQLGSVPISQMGSVPSAAAAPHQAKVDAPPRQKRTIKPDYPIRSRKNGEEGNVLLEFLVSAEGVAKYIHVISSSGFEELDAAAIKAVKTASFRPAERNGRHVEATARITLKFSLTKLSTKNVNNSIISR